MAARNGVRIAVRLTPKASRSRIGPIAREADGAAAFKARVTAPPQDGKANAALIKLLAKKLGVAKTKVSIASGATSRRKILHVAGDARALMAQLNTWE
ncbi:MAG: DUF167 domain-containing protein [Alphaproteobacteria bacterium]